MKLFRLVSKILFVLTFLVAGVFVFAVPPSGLWKGEIRIPGKALAIEVSLDKSEEGIWSGTINIPAQGG